MINKKKETYESVKKKKMKIFQYLSVKNNRCISLSIKSDLYPKQLFI